MTGWSLGFRIDYPSRETGVCWPVEVTARCITKDINRVNEERTIEIINRGIDFMLE
jgi:hypothetical protein